MARRLICFRIGEGGLAKVDAYAQQAGLSRSDAIRTLLGAGLSVLAKK